MKVHNKAPFNGNSLSLTISTFDLRFPFISRSRQKLSGRYTDQIMSKTQAPMVNPPDKTRPKCQIPANSIEPTLDIGCTPNNHVVEQGMNSVQIPREAQKTIEARKSKDGDEGEEDDVESILSLTLDPSAFRAPEEDDEDTPPSLNLGSGLGLDLKDVTMNNSSTVISSQHKNQHEQDVLASESTLHDRDDHSSALTQSTLSTQTMVTSTPTTTPTPSDTSHISQTSKSTDPTTPSSTSLPISLSSLPDFPLHPH